MPDGPAYRIETERLLLRCFEPADARVLHDVLADNVAHLAPWLEWARDEPQPLALRVVLLRTFRRRFDGDEDHAYAIFARKDGRLIGSVALHKVPDEPNVRSVGYWLAHDACGRGLATEAVAAVVRCAFEIEDAARVEIHCEAHNAASRALAERLGFRLDAELRDRGHAPGIARAVHSLLAAEYPESPAAQASATAFDVLSGVLFEPPRKSAGLR